MKFLKDKLRYGLLAWTSLPIFIERMKDISAVNIVLSSRNDFKVDKAVVCTYSVFMINAIMPWINWTNKSLREKMMDDVKPCSPIDGQSHAEIALRMSLELQDAANLRSSSRARSTNPAFVADFVMGFISGQLFPCFHALSLSQRSTSI